MTALSELEAELEAVLDTLKPYADSDEYPCDWPIAPMAAVDFLLSNADLLRERLGRQILRLAGRRQSP